MTDEVRQAGQPDDLRRTIAAIDSCRPGHDDHLRPELSWLAEQLAADRQLRQLYERRQRFDVIVAQAYQDVPVPWGLEERLLSRLGLLPASAAEVDSASAGVNAVVTIAEAPASIAAGPHRRHWLALATAACVAIAAGGLAMLIWWGQPAGKFTAEDVLSEALAFHRSLDERAELELAEAHVRNLLPASPWVVAAPGVVGRLLPDHSLLGSGGMRYELPGQDGRVAWLYVLPLDGRRPGALALPSAPDRSVLATGGFALTTWQEDNRLLVLVVEGDRRSLRSLLQQRGPVA